MVRDWLIERAKRTPYFHLAGYMNRYWLVPYREAKAGDGCGPVSFLKRPIAWVLQRFDIAARVHEILRSDYARDPHDHPWDYVTVILGGGYWEARYDSKGNEIGIKWHGPGSVLYRPANSLHKLILPTGQTCWTLFITSKYQQGWGFQTPSGKVPWRKYEGRL